MKHFTLIALAVFALFAMPKQPARADNGVWPGCGNSTIWAEGRMVSWDHHRVRFHGTVTMPNSGWMVTSIECFCDGNGVTEHQTPTTKPYDKGWEWTTDFSDLPAGEYELFVKVTYMSTGWPMAVCPVWGSVTWVISDGQ